jgi:di/tricarboxylate transporter
MLCLMGLLFTGCIEGSVVLNGIGNPSTIVVTCMFVIAAGLKRTSLITDISKVIRKITNNSYRLAYFGVLILGGFVTSLMSSPLTAFAITFPIMDAVCDEYGVSRSKAQFPLCVMCVTCAAMLPLGYAISQAAVYDGLMTTYGFTQGFLPMDFTRGRLPILIIILAWAMFVAPKIMPEEPILPIKNAGVSATNQKPLSPLPNRMGCIIFVATIVGMALDPITGLPAWQVVVSGCILEVIFGVLTGPEAIGAMAIDIGLMFVGTNGMASALVGTGAGEFIGNLLASAFGNTRSSLLLCAVFFIFPFVLTQFMLNMGVVNIFGPIVLLVSSSMNADLRGLLVLVAAGALSAFMYPTGSPAIPLMMAAGGYDVKSLPRLGWMLGVALCISYVLYVNWVYPAF